jgi:hypothetical protein
MDATESATSDGVYLSFARVVARNVANHHRTWLGLRAEYLYAPRSEGGSTLGAYGRLDWEIFGPTVGAGATSDSCGGGVAMAYGTSALGLYLETGARNLLDGGHAYSTTAGITVRLPFLAGMAYDLCSND